MNFKQLHAKVLSEAKTGKVTDADIQKHIDEPSNRNYWHRNSDKVDNLSPDAKNMYKKELNRPRSREILKQAGITKPAMLTPGTQYKTARTVVTVLDNYVDRTESRYDGEKMSRRMIKYTTTSNKTGIIDFRETAFENLMNRGILEIIKVGTESVEEITKTMRDKWNAQVEGKSNSTSSSEYDSFDDEDDYVPLGQEPSDSPEAQLVGTSDDVKQASVDAEAKTGAKPKTLEELHEMERFAVDQLKKNGNNMQAGMWDDEMRTVFQYLVQRGVVEVKPHSKFKDVDAYWLVESTEAITEETGDTTNASVGITKSMELLNKAAHPLEAVQDETAGDVRAVINRALAHIDTAYNELEEVMPQTFEEGTEDYPKIKSLSKNPSSADHKKGETYTVYHPDTKKILTSSIKRDSAKAIVAEYPDLEYNSSSWVADNIK